MEANWATYLVVIDVYLLLVSITCVYLNKEHTKYNLGIYRIVEPKVIGTIYFHLDLTTQHYVEKLGKQ